MARAAAPALGRLPLPGGQKLMGLIDRYIARLPKKKTKEELDEHYKKVELEKGDLPAMIIAAFITFFPVLVIAMVVFYGVMWLLFMR